jgi:SAM-dependent methyltransferase
VGTRYAFGDGDLAVRRIGLVADLFAPSSRALLARAAADRPATALDLGCGPGHTTRLLAEVCRPGRTIGLDSSERYLAAARAAPPGPAGGGPGPTYARHDVTVVPLPGAPAELIYARLVLAHLPDPLGLVERWRSQLAPGGRLVLEEVESIEAPPGTLRDYEELVTAVVAAEGGIMAAGPVLARLGGDCVEVAVDVADAARMFGLNLAVWGDDARARGLATAAQLERLAGGLARLADAPPGRAAVHWVLRQLVCGVNAAPA